MGVCGEGMCGEVCVVGVVCCGVCGEGMCGECVWWGWCVVRVCGEGVYDVETNVQ